jgi:uncharacterized membrane protein YccC
MIARIGACLLIGVSFLYAQKPDDQSVRTAVDAYRRMWQAMTSEQRKTMIDAGGATPDRYEQTLRMQLPGTPKSLAPAPAGAARTELSDTIRTSSEDLNVVRDANLLRLRDETCPPEVALEIAALRSSSSPAVMPGPAALLALAENWFQRPPSTAAPKAVERANVAAEIERLLGACKR